MASIVPNENHPQETILHSLGGSEYFELSAGGSFETDDRDLLSNASIHPWLDVEYDVEETEDFTVARPSLDPEDDALSSENDPSFDIERVRAAHNAAIGVDDHTALAVESGLDQNEAVTSDDDKVAFTFAADDTEDEVED